MPAGSGNVARKLTAPFVTIGVPSWFDTIFISRMPTPPKRPALRFANVHVALCVPGGASENPAFHPVSDAVLGLNVGEPPGAERSTVVSAVHVPETIFHIVAATPTIDSA